MQAAPMPDLAGRRVLLAYGLAGEVISRLGPIGFDYMGTQLAWLRASGAEASVVTLPTTAPVERNAALLARILLEQPEPCLLLAHSKGGLESLAALLQPGVAAHCAGFLAIQSPFFGSVLADAILRSRPLHGAARQLARLLGAGTGEGLVDLTTPVRAEWMSRHAGSVAALTASLPVLSIGSQVTRATAVGPDRRYLPLAEWLERRGAGPNDGMVPVSSTLLPGARHWLLNASHRALVSTGEGRDPVGLLRRALEALLTPAPPSPAIPLPSAS
jgi:alpha-beta hydrolase superfamily lysophospholipase